MPGEAGRLALVGVYSDPARDPRGHTVAVAYVTRVANAKAMAGDDAAAAEWVEDWKVHKLAFDHDRIIADALRMLRRPR